MRDDAYLDFRNFKAKLDWKPIWPEIAPTSANLLGRQCSHPYALARRKHSTGISFDKYFHIYPTVHAYQPYQTYQYSKHTSMSTQTKLIHGRWLLTPRQTQIRRLSGLGRVVTVRVQKIGQYFSYYSRISVIRLSVVSPTGLYVQLV